MKKLYLMAALTLMAAASHAQNSAVSGCIKATGEIDIFFDVAKNCTLGPANSADSLGSRTEIGFHSGVNGWTSVREWNSNAALRGIRTSGTGTTSVFKVTLADPTAYYGLTAAPSVINFVFNDGAQGNAATPNYPWAAEGKDQGATGCNDFLVTVSELVACDATGIQQVRNLHQVSITPNPFSNTAVLTFDHPGTGAFSLKLMNIAGQEVRSYSNIQTGTVEIKRNELAAGLYFAQLQGADGRVSTSKIIVE